MSGRWTVSRRLWRGHYPSPGNNPGQPDYNPGRSWSRQGQGTKGQGMGWRGLLPAREESPGISGLTGQRLLKGNLPGGQQLQVGSSQHITVLSPSLLCSPTLINVHSFLDHDYKHLFCHTLSAFIDFLVIHTQPKGTGEFVLDVDDSGMVKKGNFSLLVTVQNGKVLIKQGHELASRIAAARQYGRWPCTVVYSLRVHATFV